MKRIINIIYPAFAVLALGCFSVLPTMQAVSPAPDGGYPGGNTAEGQNALLNLTSGGYNTAVGWLSLRSNSTNSLNTAIGAGALFANAADDNTAIGAAALISNITGENNTATGVFTLFSNTLGNGNTAIGFEPLASNTTGNINTAVGSQALNNSTTGSSNVALGADAGLNVTTANGVICIGTGVSGENVSGTCFIGNIFGVTSSGGSGVFINNAGQLGTTTSSKRFKDDIKPMDKTSEALFALKPVTFRYKKDIDPRGIQQLGLVAEDVEKVNPDLIVRDKEGKAYSVRYDQVNAMLLNEFLKEHEAVQELKKQVAELTAGLQKVSAQLELSKPAPQTVVNNQ
jgi:Chaperone of endosialidase